MKHKAIIAVIGGSILQWYDFALFGTLAPILAREFFPTSDKTTGLLYTFAAFAVTFLLAPVGAMLFGHVGDKLGRKRVLTWSIILMTIPTALIAILPTYQTIGILASVLLVSLRLLQGLTASPEFSSATIFMVESAPKNRQAFYASLATLGYTIGLILGSFITWKVFILLPHTTWAWRLPFAISIIGALIVLALRYYLLEPLKLDAKPERLPLLHAIKTNLRACLLTISTAWYQGVLAYGIFIWSVTYLHMYLHLSLPLTLLAVTLSLLASAISQPFFGYLADTIGKRIFAIIGAIMLLLILTPLLILINSSQVTLVFAGMISLGLLIALALAPVNAMAILQFNPAHRMSGFGTFFNIGMAVFGGTAPLTLTAVLHVSSWWIVAYFMLAIVVGLVTVCLYETNQVKINN